MERLRAAALAFVAALLFVGVALAQALAPIPPLTGPVIDTTGTLDAAAVQALEQQARALQQRKGAQLQVLVVPTTQPEDIAQYAVRAFEQYRLGREASDDGVLLVVAKDDRRARIEVGYGLEGAIPDATAFRVIQEYLVPRFRANDYAGGLRDATAQLVRLVDGEALPPPTSANARDAVRMGPNPILGVFAAWIVALIVRGLLRRRGTGLRSLIGAGAAGGAAFAVAPLLGVAFFGAIVGLLVGGASAGGGRYARHGGLSGGWPVGIGSGGWGGGSSGGFGGGGFGGWSGGGGMSGGGGASGSW